MEGVERTVEGFKRTVEDRKEATIGFYRFYRKSRPYYNYINLNFNYQLQSTPVLMMEGIESGSMFVSHSSKCVHSP